MKSKIEKLVIICAGVTIGFMVGYYQGCRDGYNHSHNRPNRYKYCVIHVEGV